MSRPLAVAHRFGNDLTQLAAAVDAGVDAIEVDVWRHRGRLEVRHARALGALPVLYDRGRLLDGRGPRLPLRDVVAATPDDIALLVDVKSADPQLGPDLSALLDDVGRTGQVLVCGKVWPVLDALREEPRVELMHTIGSPRLLAQAKTLLGRRAAARELSVSVPFALLADDGQRAAVQALASRVFTWRVNTEAALAQCRAWGVHGAISDELPLLRTLAAEPR